MTSASKLRFPAPLEGDDEEVRWALLTAKSLWDAGNGDEAVRWLRKAAASAESVAHDRRAVALFKSAAEVADAAASAMTLPRPTAPKRRAPQRTLHGHPIPAPRPAPKPAAKRPSKPPRSPAPEHDMERTLPRDFRAHAPAPQPPQTENRVIADVIKAIESGQYPAVAAAQEASLAEISLKSVDDSADSLETTLARHRFEVSWPARIALVSCGRGAHPLAMLLGPDSPKPPGAAVIEVRPLTDADADLALAMFRLAPK